MHSLSAQAQTNWINSSIAKDNFCLRFLKVKTLVCVFTFFCFLPKITSLHAQTSDLVYGQFFTAPQCWNPALTGAIPHFRISSLNRMQFPSTGGKLTTSLAAFDYNLDEQNSGFGATIFQDNLTLSAFQHSIIGLQYAYRVQLYQDKNNPWFARIGLSANVGNKRINYAQLTFADQFGGGDTSEDFPRDHRFYPDFATGAVIYSPYFWFGLSAQHLNRANVAMFNVAERLQRRLSLQIGGKKVFKSYFSGNTEAENSLSPALMIDFQGQQVRMQVGSNFVYGLMNFGLWYQHFPSANTQLDLPTNRRLSVLAGIRLEKLYIGYTYDHNLTAKMLNAWGIHELCVSFGLKYDDRTKSSGFRLKNTFCPVSL